MTMEVCEQRVCVTLASQIPNNTNATANATMQVRQNGWQSEEHSPPLHLPGATSDTKTAEHGAGP